MNLFANKDLLKILTYSILLKRKPQNSQPQILILFGGVIGDSILFFDSLKTIISFYQTQNMEVIFVCNTVVEHFLRAIRTDISVTIISYDMHEITHNFNYFLNFIRRLSSVQYELIIRPIYSKRADFIALNLFAKEKLALNAELTSIFSAAYWLDRLAYTKRLAVKHDRMALVGYKELLHSLGCSAYKTQLTPFKTQQSSYHFENHKPYCVVCPTAREFEKVWAGDKFCSVINYLIDSFDLNVYICAGDEGLGWLEANLPLLKHPFRIVDYTAKTSFTDWVDLIRNASFCFGCDSASTHIAAYTGVKYIAVTSGFVDKFVLPYKVDIVSKLDALPVVISHPLPCFGCFFKDGFRGAGNRECKRNIKKNGRHLCIELISVDDAIEAINRLHSQTSIIK